jgi:hypothetical protein
VSGDTSTAGPILSPDGLYRWSDGVWELVAQPPSAAVNVAPTGTGHRAPRRPRPRLPRPIVRLAVAGAVFTVALAAAIAVPVLRNDIRDLLPGQGQHLSGTVSIGVIYVDSPRCAKFPVRMRIANGTGKVLTSVRATTRQVAGVKDRDQKTCDAYFDVRVPDAEAYKVTVIGALVPVVVHRNTIRHGDVGRLVYHDPRAAYLAFEDNPELDAVIDRLRGAPDSGADSPAQPSPVAGCLPPLTQCG